MCLFTHHRTISFATKACMDSWKEAYQTGICPTDVLTMLNFGPPAAEIGWRVWGTPANFNGFRVLASLPPRRRSTEANQTLHGVWPSGAGRLLYIFGCCCPVTEFYHVQNSLCVQVLRSPILAALLHSTRVVGISQSLRH